MAMTTIEFTVEGMHCSHCEGSVRDQVQAVEGVAGVRVSAQTGRLVVDGDRPLSETAIVTAVGAAGYTATKA